MTTTDASVWPRGYAAGKTAISYDVYDARTVCVTNNGVRDVVTVMTNNDQRATQRLTTRRRGSTWRMTRATVNRRQQPLSDNEPSCGWW